MTINLSVKIEMPDAKLDHTLNDFMRQSALLLTQITLKNAFHPMPQIKVEVAEAGDCLCKGKSIPIGLVL